MLDCFTVILVNRPAIADGAFRAYLFKMARNKANRQWKLRFRRQEFSLDEDLPVHGGFVRSIELIKNYSSDEESEGQAHTYDYRINVIAAGPKSGWGKLIFIDRTTDHPYHFVMGPDQSSRLIGEYDYEWTDAKI